jgi:neopullulanase
VLFSYACGVFLNRRPQEFLSRILLVSIFVLSFWFAPTPALLIASPRRGQAAENSPIVKQIDPPNWWIGLTPELLVLLTGQRLEATNVACNMPNLLVERTQAAAGGNYLFVWLRFGANLRSGTAVCRITTPAGATSFELPLAARGGDTIHKFQGLAPEDVLYLIMPDRFANGDPSNDEPAEFPGSHDRAKPRAYHGGDFRGVQQHLSYLKDLGVTTLWLTPVVKNGAAQDYHGYGAVDFYAVDPHFGALKDYQELVAAAHRQRMKILFDLVPNHVGPKHPWAANPPQPNWFHGTPQRHLNASSALSATFYGQPEHAGHDLFEAIIDPHASPGLSRSLTEGWFANVLPDLNTENPLVVKYLVQNSIWWAESSGLDGYRVDTVPYVAREFWSRWTAELRRIYPRLTTIGEVFHPDPSVTSFFVGGQKRYDGIDTGLSTVFDYAMYFSLRDILLRGAPAGRIPNVLRDDWLYTRPDELVTFFGNHDVPRFAGAEGSSLAKLKLAFGLALTLRGIPELYYGDEIGMAGGGDPDNRRDFPGGWREDATNAFVEAGRTRDQQDIFAYVQKLLRVRREHPALSGGRLWHLVSDDSAYVFVREAEEEQVLVVFNNSAQSRDLRVPLTDTPAHGTTRVTLLFGEAKAELNGKEIHISAPSQSLSIFALN